MVATKQKPDMGVIYVLLVSCPSAIAPKQTLRVLQEPHEPPQHACGVSLDGLFEAAEKPRLFFGMERSELKKGKE
ncbi:hypothetical protein BALCAV_0200100 [Alkalihalobacillus alcalophilus ATCC 27647 = CGMCC 1.3604]|uniref:Uncharacterized protein n=1 Tax=Alkalihalobacillus alcalophilus ATCC 27647 = CGMCC 1.3604 TaxID=1218173 RepID=A0A094YZU7_ALKAL|nr:hypothetical protein BALCAV_0200100 [Alkalihalobacillus alcalophilus ATCC 27647 = CGMCC 1.3604]